MSRHQTESWAQTFYTPDQPQSGQLVNNQYMQLRSTQAVRFTSNHHDAQRHRSLAHGSSSSVCTQPQQGVTRRQVAPQLTNRTLTVRLHQPQQGVTRRQVASSMALACRNFALPWIATGRIHAAEWLRSILPKCLHSTTRRSDVIARASYAIDHHR